MANYGIHRAGTHIIEAFEDYAVATSNDTALDLFLDAIRGFQDHDNDGRADWGSSWRQRSRRRATTPSQRDSTRNSVQERVADVVEAMAPLNLLPSFDEVSPPDDRPAPESDHPGPPATSSPGTVSLSGFTCYWVEPGRFLCIRSEWVE